MTTTSEQREGAMTTEAEPITTAAVLDELAEEASRGRRNGDPYEAEYAQGLADAVARIRATLPEAQA